MMAILYAKFMGLKRNLSWILLMAAFPMILTFFFGGGMGRERKALPMVNEDQSVYSTMLIEEIQKSNAYDITEIERREAERLVREQEALFSLVIPKGFMEAIEGEHKTNIMIIRSIETLDIYALQSVLNSALQKVATERKIVAAGMEILSRYGAEASVEERLSQVVSSKLASDGMITVKAKTYGEDTAGRLEPRTSSSAGFLLFFSMYPLTFLVGDILEDKKLLIWNRLIISPVSKIKMYSANMVFAFIVGMAQMVLLVILNKVIFNITWTQNTMGLILLLGVFSFTVIGLGLLLSAFVKTPQQLSAIAPIVLTSTSMLGGLMWPVEIITNKVLLFLARLTPQFWAMEAFNKLMYYNAPTKDILFPVMVLFLIGILFLGISLKIRESPQ
ncbi:ABC transporter permease [Alkaliphilus oremlandii]|uniref:ABC-2 type transporter n=1 Tax=Alkaliphilus oremlandii (strain OhILAs) TaxID=350688 RepID=A8MJY2_ALKOO|nr:ABC transporter permease [Alkaliphilus oremlandii]ABW20114.1 ABC-2 type transporter [Alkaliphilus oremlandii OhILAs]